jgi:hypothetical protein
MQHVARSGSLPDNDMPGCSSVRQMHNDQSQPIEVPLADVFSSFAEGIDLLCCAY